MQPNATPNAAPDPVGVAMPDLRKIGFQVARIAHWMANDSGYTRRMAVSDLRSIARRLLPPEEYMATIGDAEKLP